MTAARPRHLLVVHGPNARGTLEVMGWKVISCRTESLALKVAALGERAGYATVTVRASAVTS